MSGKRERPRDLEIDEKTLQYKDNNQSERGEKKVSTPQEIAARKIYKIKTTFSSDAPQQQSSKPNFKFIQSKDEKDQKEKKEENQQKDTQKEKGEPVDKEKETPKEQEKKPVFGSNNIFGNSIFGKSPVSTGLFGNQTSLFSKSGETKSNLGEGLFSKKSETGKPGSMFGSGSIFNFNSNGVPPLKKQGEPAFKGGEEDEGDSAQLQKEQKEVIDPSKSSGTYVYESECEVLFSQKAKKIKKGNGEVVQNIEVVFEFDASKNHHWLLVRLAATKKQIISGLIVKKISEVKNMNQKDENVWVSVLVSRNEKLEKQVLKIQFEEASMGKELISKISKVIKQQ